MYTVTIAVKDQRTGTEIKYRAEDIDEATIRSEDYAAEASIGILVHHLLTQIDQIDGEKGEA